MKTYVNCIQKVSTDANVNGTIHLFVLIVQRVFANIGIILQRRVEAYTTNVQLKKTEDGVDNISVKFVASRAFVVDASSLLVIRGTGSSAHLCRLN